MWHKLQACLSLPDISLNSNTLNSRKIARQQASY